MTTPRMFWLCLVIGVIVGLAGFALWAHRGPAASPAAVSPSDTTGVEATAITTTSSNDATATDPIIPQDWETETVAAGHYTLAHPADWQRFSDLETSASAFVAGSVTNISDRRRPDATEWLPDLRVNYYETDGDLAGVDGQPLRYPSLAEYLDTSHRAATGVVSSETKIIGAYPGYLVELPGIGGMLNYMTSVAGHVYVFTYNINQQQTAEQIIGTFRVTTN